MKSKHYRVILRSDQDYDEHIRKVELRGGAEGQFGDYVLDKAERIAGKEGASAPRRQSLINQAMKAKKTSQRLFWLRQEADGVNAAALPESACRNGCSHCCHIGVTMSETEAKLIAKEVGTKLRDPDPEHVVVVDPAAALSAEEGLEELQRAQDKAADRYFGTPCVFLKDGACSIYKHRPMACRQLINLDDDDLLCQLVEGAAVRVPYLDQRLAQMFYTLVLGSNVRMADIRDWFAGE